MFWSKLYKPRTRSAKNKKTKKTKHNSGIYLVLSFLFMVQVYPSRKASAMVKAMDCRIDVSELVHQSRYYVHFRANTLGKGMTPLILPDMG